MSEITFYDVLGVRTDAEQSEIRRAYVALARKHHPDYHIDDRVEVRLRAEEMMRVVNIAWNVLGNDGRRQEYDRRLQLSGQWESSPPATEPERSAVGEVVDDPRTPVLGLVLAVLLLAAGGLAGLPPLMIGGIATGVVTAVLAARHPAAAA